MIIFYWAAFKIKINNIFFIKMFEGEEISGNQILADALKLQVFIFVISIK